MKKNEGTIDIIKIENSGPNADQIGTLTARFVRYPGSQQLSVWLPEPGGSYDGKFRILDTLRQKVLDEKRVEDT